MYLITFIKGYPFPPPIWAEPATDAPRTTNCAESFHKHFNSQFYSPRLPLTSVIENLKLIQVESYLKINELKKGKIKPRCKEEKEKIQLTYEAWSLYRGKHFLIKNFFIHFGESIYNNCIIILMLL